MSGTTVPDPNHVHRGAIALSTALRLSTLLPQEQQAIFAILRSLNSAEQQLHHPAGQLVSDAYAASLLAAIVDTYRPELAQLGA